ncbi:MAG TPA: DUF6572 domain-containing protein [Xanthobacteraceae bacterium]|jgi:hypothetical protein|nr:DUF6572 domain-containing protein [Xanthobacteraceae bacterium]
MSIDQTDKIDFVHIEYATGDVLLTISDHLSWDEDEGAHLLLLQAKMNTYLAFIEGGQMYRDIPEARGRPVVINLVEKYPLSGEAESFFGLARKTIQDAGFSLRFRLGNAQKGVSGSQDHELG